MRRTPSIQLILFFALFFLSLPLWIQLPTVRADVFWIEGQEDPVYGILVKQDVETVTINQTVDGLRFEQKEHVRSSLTSMVINYDVPRLELLTPANLSHYRDLAEELSAQKADPVARGVATRLYLIVAANGDQALRKSSLAGLVRLANDSEELTRWQTLQFLFDEDSSQPVPKRTQADGPDASTKAKMLKLVRMLRKGKSVSGSIGKEVVEHWSDVCRPAELLEISRANRPSEEQLRKLLQIEFQIRNPDAISRSETGTEDRWGVLAALPSRPTALIPNFANATQYDPQKSVFRGGRWVRPASK